MESWRRRSQLRINCQRYPLSVVSYRVQYVLVFCAGRRPVARSAVLFIIREWDPGCSCPRVLLGSCLQQSTAHHRGLFVSLSRDIHWIKQKQQDRKKLKQANCLLHEKTTELKEKLAATEKQAEGTRRGLEEKVNELKDKLSATEKQAERTLEEKTNELKVLLRPLQLPARSARSPPRDSPSPPTPLARTSLRRPRRRPRAPSEGWKSSCLPPRTTVTPPGRRPRSVTTRSSRRRATTPARDPPS